MQDACAADGQNTICLNQSDPAFTTGVLAFSRIITADLIGQSVNASTPTSDFVGQILDADILLRPADPTVTFATPAALSSNPAAYDLESVLTQEIGNLLGFGASDVWNAVMFPFVAAPGTFLGSRPSTQTPDAPLADDDRAAVRAMYPDPSDTKHIGSISGHVLPANPLALAGEPAGTTGIFAAQVVAVDAGTGSVAAASISGWSCSDPGPPVFDGSYSIERLAVGASQAYQVYAEPLDGPVSPGDVFNAVHNLPQRAHRSRMAHAICLHHAVANHNVFGGPACWTMNAPTTRQKQKRLRRGIGAAPGAPSHDLGKLAG